MKFRTFVIIQFTVMLIIILTLFTLVIFTRGSESRLIGKTIIDHGASTMIYNESQSFGVKVTATVLESPCRACLKSKTLDECWSLDECLDVNKD